MVDKLPTSYDVARLAGVSRTTVSLVLNNAPAAHISPETRRRVLEAARQLGYFPHAAARRLVQGRTMTVALIWHRGPDANYRDAFLPGLLQGLASVLHQQGYYLLFRPMEVHESEQVILELAQGRHADGFVISGPRADDPVLLDLHERGFPLVLHGQLPGTDIPFVDVDNVAGARQAVEHLLRLGHTRIGIITNAPLSYVSARQRLEGYRLAMRAAGIEPSPEWIQYGNFDEASGRRAMQALLQVRPRPSAVFVASDMVAVGARYALWEAGLRVPEDIALVGFDDLPLAAYTVPPLTTVHVPAQALGRAVGELVLQRIQGASVASRRLSTTLVVRASCGARPSSSRPNLTHKEVKG